MNLAELGLMVGMSEYGIHRALWWEVPEMDGHPAKRLSGLFVEVMPPENFAPEFRDHIRVLVEVERFDENGNRLELSDYYAPRLADVEIDIWYRPGEPVTDIPAKR